MDERCGLIARLCSIACSSEPVEKLAQEWALSGRGLARACHRLRIPMPPRGFWARAQNGRRMHRPRLPELSPGEAEEIVICVPE